MKKGLGEIEGTFSGSILSSSSNICVLFVLGATRCLVRLAVVQLALSYNRGASVESLEFHNHFSISC